MHIHYTCVILQICNYKIDFKGFASAHDWCCESLLNTDYKIDENHRTCLLSGMQVMHSHHSHNVV